MCLSLSDTCSEINEIPQNAELIFGFAENDANDDFDSDYLTRVQPCLTWQPLLKPGIRRLQIRLLLWRPLLLRPLLGSALAESCLRP